MKVYARDGYRLLGYAAGFLLFFGPVALFQRAIAFLLGYQSVPIIHSLCFRIPIEHLLDGKFFVMGLTASVGTILLFAAAFFWGPLFCGHLCPAGAVPEYFSKAIPARFKINWSRAVPVTPLRYGFLLGFALAPFTGGYLACTYCNFYVFDLFANYALWGRIVAFTSSQLVTIILWLFVLGLFTQGGRGFCNFFCPVGALQNLIYSLGCKLPFSWRLRINPTRCNGCGRCADACPMTSLRLSAQGLERNIHNCILCFECVNHCPTGAIAYTRRDGKRENHVEQGV